MGFFRVLAMVTMLAVFCSSAAFAQGELKVGDQGSEVAEVQGQLMVLGYDVVADGDFGAATADALREFQALNGMQANGFIDSQTYMALLGKDMPEITTGSSYIGRQLISTSMQYIGVPYVFGGTSPYGFDCSGFVQYVFAKVGVSLPRTADVQFEVGTPVSTTDLRPGDAVFFETYTYGASHVGIYIGDGNFIHASSSRGVTISSLGSAYYSSHYLGARRMW